MKRTSFAWFNDVLSRPFPNAARFLPLLVLLCTLAFVTPLHAAACWPAWSSTTAYVGGSDVSYDNVNYTAAYWTENNIPSTSNGAAGSGEPWISEGSCSGSGGATPTPTSTPKATPTPTSSGCTPTAITPYIQVNGGSWAEESSATVSAGASVNLGPQPVTGGSWSWSGPNGYSSTSRQIAITVNSTSTYTATYTNSSGCQSTEVFTLTVIGSATPTPTPTPVTGCTPTSITPYIQVNGGSWAEESSATVSAGASVNLGPQPVTSGSWSWSGPNGYSSTSRQIGITVSSTSTYTATYTNSCGSTSTQAFTLTANSTGGGGGGGGTGGNGRVMVGYWHDWETPEFIQLADVPSSYDIIVVAFATYNGSGNFTFTVDPDETQAQFIADIKTLHSEGKKVLISCGGASETPSFASSSDASNFASSVSSLISQYGFDGVDIDFENGAIYLNANDLDINNPTTPSVVYTIQALQDFHSLQPNAMITFAPIPNYLQAAYQYYGPGPYGDSNWNGAQLPVINNIRNILTYVWPQYYNEANIEALDGNLYSEGSEDNLVAMSEMLTKGFPVAYSAGTFNPLNQQQVVLGVPACAEASPGNMTNAQLEAAFSYLNFGGSPVGSYVLRNSSGYPDVSGYMTWSINWDVYCQNGTLGSGIKSYLNGLPAN